jgi:hypothetical protein
MRWYKYISRTESEKPNYVPNKKIEKKKTPMRRLKSKWKQCVRKHVMNRKEEIVQEQFWDGVSSILDDLYISVNNERVIKPIIRNLLKLMFCNMKSLPEQQR